MRKCILEVISDFIINQGEPKYQKITYSVPRTVDQVTL